MHESAQSADWSEQQYSWWFCRKCERRRKKKVIQKFPVRKFHEQQRDSSQVLGPNLRTSLTIMELLPTENTISHPVFLFIALWDSTNNYTNECGSMVMTQIAPV